MKKLKLILVLIVALSLVLGLVGCGTKKTTEVEPIEGEVTDLAEGFVDYIVAEDFESAVAMFDDNMKKAMSVSKFEQTWSQLQKQVGGFERKISNRVEKIKEYDVVFVTCKFEQDNIDIKVVFNKDKRIAGLFFEPAKDVDVTEYSPPIYSQPKNFTESEITIGNDEWALPGTLTIPNGEGPFPALVLIHGSGPSDRDSTIGPNKPLKDLAWGLANQGIAVLRYDKRTLVYGQKLASLQNSITVNEETIIDANRGVELLLENQKIDNSKIHVLGHSLGGTLAPRIAVENDNVASIVILGGAVSPLEELILTQIKYISSLDGTLSAEEESHIKLIESHVANIKSLVPSSTTPATELLGVPASYWLDLKDYNPAQMAKNLSIPILILHGARDYQVNMDELNMWKNTLEGRNNVEFKLYSNLNHLFIAGEGQSNPAEYEIPGNVDEQVIKDISRWIKDN
ncbi:alpha/beta fold hydrolase [Serpentinicella alkaliphila]|uniref:Serine aminopeptidase S33 domain-containing protein n=1 Tax=Serpentinicella alkaliphila TaxID=1734049 RepID=A0A4R2TKI0_9FIRM|nr:alpha/beta fold hydrolase [Serpentinicella alkaliphila]QUH26234.1 alpha/beta fold hydrolase [Serpentinicella alkaliphila]TCQ01695.1 hypothetical protein EDD79_102436 [Serpentinicella alkaliphila]